MAVAIMPVYCIIQLFITQDIVFFFDWLADFHFSWRSTVAVDEIGSATRNGLMAAFAGNGAFQKAEGARSSHPDQDCHAEDQLDVG
jgi:hypothetical protein